MIDELPHVAPAAFISTQYILEPDSMNEGNPGSWYAEGGWEEGLSGLSAQSFLLTKQGLLDRVRDAGYEEIDVVQDDVSYKNGPLLTFAAWTSRGSVSTH